MFYPLFTSYHKKLKIVALEFKNDTLFLFILKLVNKLKKQNLHKDNPPSTSYPLTHPLP